MLSGSKLVKLYRNAPKKLIKILSFKFAHVRVIDQMEQYSHTSKLWEHIYFISSEFYIFNIHRLHFLPSCSGRV